MSDSEQLAAMREAGHTPLPPDGGELRIVYRASEVIALGNRRYDEGWEAALAAARVSGDRETEFAWLIERGQPEGLDSPEWWSIVDQRTGAQGWSRDAWQAQRFATEALANVVITQFNANVGHPFRARAIRHGFSTTRVSGDREDGLRQQLDDDDLMLDAIIPVIRNRVDFEPTGLAMDVLAAIHHALAAPQDATPAKVKHVVVNAAGQCACGARWSPEHALRAADRDGEGIEAAEVASFLAYLWTATGKRPDLAVRDLFDDNDPIVADVERYTALAARLQAKDPASGEGALS